MGYTRRVVQESSSVDTLDAVAGDPVEIRITFEGDAPGLPAHRLSVAAFGKSLTLLLVAYRRIASGLVRAALDDPRYGRRGGKYAEVARGLDFEIAQIAHGSTGLRIVCTADVRRGASFPLFQNGFMEQAAATLLESIAAESAGTLRNSRVRKYLASLPAGLRRQTYEARRGPISIKSITVGNVHLPAPPAGPFYLAEIEGTVVGVGFEPGPHEVSIQGPDGSITSYAATPVLVELALALRHEPVAGFAVRGGSPRLVRLFAADKAPVDLSHEQTVSYVMHRWEGVLRRLA